MSRPPGCQTANWCVSDDALSETGPGLLQTDNPVQMKPPSVFYVEEESDDEVVSVKRARTDSHLDSAFKTVLDNIGKLSDQDRQTLRKALEPAPGPFQAIVDSIDCTIEDLKQEGLESSGARQLGTQVSRLFEIREHLNDEDVESALGLAGSLNDEFGHFALYQTIGEKVGELSR
jgi:hypothetical protein